MVLVTDIDPAPQVQPTRKFRRSSVPLVPALDDGSGTTSGFGTATSCLKKKIAKNIHTYNAYNLIMSAVKRIPVTEPVWKDLAEMRSAGQTYTELLSEMIEDRKRRRLEEDVKTWSSRKKKGYVSLSEIKD